MESIPANWNVAPSPNSSAISPLTYGDDAEIRTDVPNTIETTVAWTSLPTISIAEAIKIAMIGNKTNPITITRSNRGNPSPTKPRKNEVIPNIKNAGNNTCHRPYLSEISPINGCDNIPAIWDANTKNDIDEGE